MSLWQKIGIRVLGLAVLLVALNSLYKVTIYENYIETEADLLGRIWQMENMDVLYFSASSNFGFNQIDSSKERISTYISHYYPELRFGPVDKGAVHAGLFLPLMKNLPEDAPVKTIIVSMNLRSFGPSWIHSKLETPLQKSAVMFDANRPALFNRFLVSLNHYDNKSEEERTADFRHHWDHDTLPLPPPRHTVTTWCQLEKWGDWRNPKRQLADHFIKNYGFVIDADNPRIQDFDAIADWAIKRDIKVVFNIMAENMQLADSLVGPELTNLIRKNRDFLKHRYSYEFDARYHDTTLVVVDNLGALSDAQFYDRDFPTEHYLSEGRMTIARNVAYAIRRFHRGKFKRTGFSPKTFHSPIPSSSQ